MEGQKCYACGGAAHPSTGQLLAEDRLLCGPCVLNFTWWMNTHAYALGHTQSCEGILLNTDDSTFGHSAKEDDQ